MGSKKTELSPDVVMKDFWRDNKRFADLFNAYFFDGKQVVKPEELMEMDTDVSALIPDKALLETLTRRWDVVKRTNNGCFQIMAIETQQHIHYAMPLRCMIYEGLSYVAAMKYVIEKDGVKKWPDSDEFLSKLRKEDRLPPCYCIVIYSGAKPWDGPKELLDMMNIPQPFNGVHFNNYKMNLIELNKFIDYPFQEKSVRDFFGLVYTLYNSQLNTAFETFCDAADEVWYTGFAVAGVKEFGDISVLKREEKISMCENVKRQLEAMCDAEKASGRAEGKAEARKAVIINSLNSGIGKDILLLQGFTEAEIHAAEKEIAEKVSY